MSKSKRLLKLSEDAGEYVVMKPIELDNGSKLLPQDVLVGGEYSNKVGEFNVLRKGTPVDSVHITDDDLLSLIYKKVLNYNMYD